MAAASSSTSAEVHPSRKTYQGTHEDISELLLPFALAADFLDYHADKTKLDIKKLRTPCFQRKRFGLEIDAPLPPSAPTA